MSFRLFIIGLLAWLILPSAVIGGFYAYTRISNEAPKPGPLVCRIDANVLWAGDTADYSVTFDGADRKPGEAPPKPIDLILAVDISSSIGSALPVLTNAVSAAARSLAGSADVRFALVTFDTNAQRITDWNPAPQVLEKGLQSLKAGGGTDVTPVFPVVTGLKAQGRSGARTLLVLFTDGGFSVSPSTEDAAKAMRHNGDDIYVVGLPQQALPDTAYLLAGQAENVFNTASIDDLARQFQNLRDRIVEGVGFGGRLEQVLDGQNFQTPGLSADWTATGGALSNFIGTLTPQRQTFSHPVRAETIGLWRVGQKPARLTFTNPAGALEQHYCSPRPLLLVLNGWLLLLAYLPAAAWVLWRLLTRDRDLYSKFLLGRLIVPPISAPIPLPSPAPRSPGPSQSLPTLVIGLGGAAVAAFEQIGEQAARRNGGAPDKNLIFLSLDVDTGGQSFPFTREIIPAALANLEPLVAQSKLPPHLEWFPANRYLHASADQLTVSRGSRGERMLARLALFRWTSEGGLVGALQKSVRSLMKMPASGGVRQIVIVGSDAGGFSSGALVDVARLLRRICRVETASSAAPSSQLGAANQPDVIGVLLRDGSVSEPRLLANREALRRELETAQIGGALWQPLTAFAGRGDPLLDAADKDGPFNWIFGLDGGNGSDAAAQAGHLLAVLTDRRPRWRLLAELAADERPGLLLTNVSAVQVRTDLLRDWLAAELFLRVVSSDGLVELEPSPKGGFQPAAPSLDDARKLLSEWALTGEGPLAWRDLLAAAAGVERPAAPSDDDDDESERAAPGADRGDWLRRCFNTAFSRRLAGHAENGVWKRDVPAAAAPAVLRLFADRLTNDGVEAQNIREEIADEARELANQFDNWLSALSDAVRAVHDHRAAVVAKLGRSPAAGETMLDGADIADDRLVKAAFRAWLPGYDDVGSALRERLYFSAVRDVSGVKLLLQCYIGSPCGYGSPQVAVKELMRLLSDVTALPNEIGDDRLIRHLAADGRRYAQQLVKDARPTLASLVICPDAPQSTAILDNFCAAVPEPAGYQRRLLARGVDPSAVRRVAVLLQEDAADLPELPLVSDPEVAGERLRDRLRRRFTRATPLLPPALRLAATDYQRLCAFAQAYKQGCISKYIDQNGKWQWRITDGKLLTTGNYSSLSDAALSFVFEEITTSCVATKEYSPPDFSLLERWIEGGDVDDWNDIAALAVIVLVGEDGQ